jgi:hypothetical protein
VVERLLIHLIKVPATLNGTRQLQGRLYTPDSITPHSKILDITHIFTKCEALSAPEAGEWV